MSETLILDARKVIVPYDSERFALKPSQVSAGDVVFVKDTGIAWIVANISSLYNNAGYTRLTPGLPVNVPGTGTGGVSYGAITPITLFAKSVPVLTAGSPADIAMITVPSGVARWAVCGSLADGFVCGSGIIAETAAGSLANGQFQVYSAAAAGGTLLCDTTLGPAAAGVASFVSFSYSGSAPSGMTASTSSTIYIRQTGNSSNAGTVSFYLTIYPLP